MVHLPVKMIIGIMSDQSHDSNQSVDNSGEDYWDTDVEEILKKDDDDDLHSESSLFVFVGIILWSFFNSFKPLNWVSSLCIFEYGYKLC